MKKNQFFYIRTDSDGKIVECSNKDLEGLFVIGGINVGLPPVKNIREHDLEKSD